MPTHPYGQMCDSLDLNCARQQKFVWGIRWEQHTYLGRGGMDATTEEEKVTCAPTGAVAPVEWWSQPRTRAILGPLPHLKPFRLPGVMGGTAARGVCVVTGEDVRRSRLLARRRDPPGFLSSVLAGLTVRSRQGTDTRG